VQLHGKLSIPTLILTAFLTILLQGNFNWMLALEAHPYAIEFRNATTKHWHLPASANSKDGKRTRAGDVRAAYGDGIKSGVGSYVFVSVHEAG
jgi:hypothetical protein